jgi:hypothetical protein
VTPVATLQSADALRIVLAAVDGLVALTAIGGGLALVLGLEAERFGPEWLDGTPFRSYLAPGMLLSLVVGGSAAAATMVTLLDWHGAIASGLAGLILVGWIVGEIAILNQPAPTRSEGVYLATGALILALAAVLAWT